MGPSRCACFSRPRKTTTRSPTSRTASIPALSGFYDWLQANIDMAAALEAKCYHTRWVHAADAGHANGAVIKQTLPDELVWLWQGYPIP